MSPTAETQRLIAQVRTGDPSAARELALDARRRNTLHPLLDALFGPLPEETRAATRGDASPELWRLLTQLLDTSPPGWIIDALDTALESWPDTLRVCPRTWIEAALDGGHASALRLVRALDGGSFLALIRERTESHRLDAIPIRVASALETLLKLDTLDNLRILTDFHAGPPVERGDQPWLNVLTTHLPTSLSTLEIRGVAAENVGPLLTWLDTSRLQRLTLDVSSAHPRFAAQLARSDAQHLTALATNLFLDATRWSRDQRADILRAWSRGDLRRRLVRLDLVGPRPFRYDISLRPITCLEMLLRTTWPALEHLRLLADVPTVSRILELPSTFQGLKSLELHADDLPDVLIDELAEALPNTDVQATLSPFAATRFPS